MSGLQMVFPLEVQGTKPQVDGRHDWLLETNSKFKAVDGGLVQQLHAEFNGDGPAILY
jgi:hypothetical protein